LGCNVYDNDGYGLYSQLTVDEVIVGNIFLDNGSGSWSLDGLTVETGNKI